MISKLQKSQTWRTIRTPRHKTNTRIRERKRHKNRQSRDCPGTGWVAKICLCVCFRVIPYGEETHKQNPAQKSRNNPVKITFLVLFFMFFSGQTSWGIILGANTCWACIRTSANTGIYFRGIIFRILAKFLGAFIQCKYSRACIRTCANTGQKVLANYLCVYFVPGGMLTKLHATSSGTNMDRV